MEMWGFGAPYIQHASVSGWSQIVYMGYEVMRGSQEMQPSNAAHFAAVVL